MFGSAGAMGFASLRDRSSNTSTVGRVSQSGRITGPADTATALAEPDSGTASTHDARNE